MTPLGSGFLHVCSHTLPSPGMFKGLLETFMARTA